MAHPRPILPKPAKSSSVKLESNLDVVGGGGGDDSQLAPPVLTPETDFEKLLQEETARFNLPLALRKSRRASAGMKYSLLQEETIAVDESLVFREPKSTTKTKEIKAGSKRKLDLASDPSVKGHHHHHHKHKDKHKEKHKDKHKEKHRSREPKESMEDYVPPSSKKQKIGALRDQDSRNDVYCWKCHKEGSVICCELCPRVYHIRCVKLEDEPEDDWVCQVCQRVIEAECVDTQSEAMSKLSVGQLSRLLGFALKRMRHQGTDSFQQPVSLRQFPDYASYVFNPMDLGTLEENIKKKMYGSTYAFLEETRWILHNCIIFNGSHHKLTTRAKSIVDICNYEMNEIEICPSCYLSSCLKRTNWFCEPCDPPHTVVWAKLQGFPHWQAKVLRENNGQVDVRFFGAHDRAWIPLQNCYLLSEDSPVTTKKISAKLNTASKEIKIHVDLIRELFGAFEYCPPRTPYKSGMCLLNTVQIPTLGEHKSPVRVIKKLSGKPAAFMNGIREAEAARDAQEAEEISVTDETSMTKEMEAPHEEHGNDDSRTITPENRTVSESASIDEEDSMDSMSQDSSVWSMASSFSSEKRDAVKTADSQDIDSTPVRKSVMCATAVVKRMASVMAAKTMEDSDDPLPRISDTTRKSSRPGNSKTSELTRKLSATSEDSPSKSSAPAGVFEISDQSLDVDKDELGKSPAVQLLGKVHVSPKSLLSTDLRLDKSGIKTGLSPKKLIEGRTEAPKSGVCDNTETKDSKQDVKAGITRSAIGADGDAVSSSVQATGSSIQSILPSKLPDPSNLDKTDDITPAATPPDSETPSTSRVGTPRSSDKFLMNLTKTIETMKASLGMGESMETNEDSDASSDTASMSGHDSEQDSDSSEAHSEDETNMEVDAKKEAGTEKETTPDQKDGEKKISVSDKMDNDEVKSDDEVDKKEADVDQKEADVDQKEADVDQKEADVDQKEADIDQKEADMITTNDDELTIDEDMLNMDDYDISKDAAFSADGDIKEELTTKSDVKDQGSEVASLSDGGLAMSLNSADDQSENELVIDMDRVENDQESEGQEAANEIKEGITDMPDETSDRKDIKGTKDSPVVSAVIETTQSTPSDITASDSDIAVGSKQDGRSLAMPEITPSPGHILNNLFNGESPIPTRNDDAIGDDATVDNDAIVDVGKVDDASETNTNLSINKDSVTPEHVKDIDQPSLVLPQLASQKLAEILMQKQLDITKNSSVSKPEVVTPSESRMPSTTEEKMDVDVEKASKDVLVDDDKMQSKEAENFGTKMDTGEEETKKDDGTKKQEEDEKTTEQEGECPWPQEDPLKAWGTADNLLEKYSSEVSKCVRESLTTVRREMIDSITSIDIKAKMDQLQTQVSKLTWEKEQQKQELRHIMDLTIAEMRDSLNADLKSCEASTKKEAQKEKEEAIKEIKRKQWCANCEQEAFFYCCWNTSYCTYQCQTKHWSKHQNTCQQPNTPSNNNVQVTSQPSSTSTATISLVSTPPTVNTTSTNPADRLRLISSQQSSQIPTQNIQLVQAAPHVTAAQNTGAVNAQSVQTLIRYVQAPPRLPLQPGATQQPHIIRMPVSGGSSGNQMMRAVPATIRNVGGQQQLVLTNQTLQSLQQQGKLGKLPAITGSGTGLVNTVSLGQKGVNYAYLTNQ